MWRVCRWLCVCVCVCLASVCNCQSVCPSRCLCFRTTVRCMFLSLETVPAIPQDTTILDLRFNKIKEIAPNTFKHLKSLNTLLLNNNQISRLQNGVFNGLSELRYLYLYKNKIREVESKVFQGLSKLEQLYLHFNKIEKLHPNTFTDLTKLERLFLHNNKLRHLSSGTFKGLDSLKRIRLDSNALVCDCDMMWLAHLLRDKQDSTQAAATCQFPTNMEGKPIANVSDNDFHCSKPRFTQEPTDVEVNFGGIVHFTCKAEGDPQPKIVWMRDSNEINMEDPRYSVAEDGTLKIAPMSDADLGVYECMAKSPTGEVKSRSAKMIYNKRNSKPYFLHTPQDVNADIGDSVRLDCSAAGLPSPDLLWTKDDLPVQNGGKFQISEAGTLTISRVAREDAGAYKCSAANFLGRVSSVAQLRVNVQPHFVTMPENQTVRSGSKAQLRCEADGSPEPVITWFKDGRSVVPQGRVSITSEGTLLTVEHAKESDSGLYTCLAQNQVGSAEASGELRVRGYGPRPPRLVLTPYPVNAPVASSVELPCKAEGEPLPTVAWTKDRVTLREDRNHRVFPIGSLRIYNLTVEDSGLYECIASNQYGSVSAQGTLTVEDLSGGAAPGDRYVHLAFQEAAAAVDRAINATIASLFAHNNTQRTPSVLMQLMRFPDNHSRNIIRAAEVYERTLVNIRRHIQSGLKVNLTQDFSYADILSPQQLQLVANLSGCMEHQAAVNCSDMCFHAKYRTIDGTCNNLQHPRWGSSLIGFRRLLSPIYENGFSTPIGWNKDKKYFGFPKPAARLVSTSVISTDDITPDSEITHMVMQWGQFLDHDLDHAIPSTSAESWEGIDCKKSCAYATPCFPMEVPENDPRIRNRRCIDFIRSSSVCGSGMTSVFFNTIQPREQINQLTAYIDGSQVYGFTEERAQLLRDLSSDLGLLRVGISSPAGKAMLPIAGGQEVDCRRDVTESDVGCFLAGDIRVNEQIGLTTMHTIWLREHNRVAQELRDINPHWDGHTLFYEARKIVGAEMQHITYAHWLRHVLGAKGMNMLGDYTGYNPNIDPGISNVFATAALRFGHTLINPVLRRLDSEFATIPEGDLLLGKAFFSPWRLVDEGGTDPLLRGMFMTAAKRKMPHENLNKQLTEHLFTVAHAVSLDLAAMNIQRGRDHALPPYNDYRAVCNLTVAQTFDDLRGEISNKAVRDQLQELYGHPGNIDVWVGGILEDPVDGARVGPLFRCILVDQFRRMRDGDRFWYESLATFKPEQLTQIKQASLARVLCDNGDNITRVTPDVFLLPSVQQPSLVSCRDLPAMDLRFWYECEDCDSDENELRTRRDLMNATDSRLEGLETMVQELQKSVKTLKRRIKQLTHCRDSNGTLRKEGQRWVKDACTTCDCRKEQVTCTTLVCPKLTCDRPVKKPNICCPTCE
ncbi:peroxidasin-like isoform X2 [Macrosteles quadrilineatus]|uniref:peroxidasin-like isoform X2 n=1 Tax=Macrosteles quadrilineatus TaxID=74068 RepID=UPI0023E0A41A|nr:peroxidasin-like isoform X2 [Macrosteles quadrilineatus]